jgi:uncharacterized membrane protein YidH (DUF202 family)
MTDEDMASTRSRSATSLELASRNTGLAVQRTRMNADRTLMSVIRTSLSLVSFGFTISTDLSETHGKQSGARGQRRGTPFRHCIGASWHPDARSWHAVSPAVHACATPRAEN